MAKTARKHAGKREPRRNPPITADERDAARAKGPDEPTAKERREGAQLHGTERALTDEQAEYREAKEEQNRRDYQDSDPVGAGDEDLDHLPIHHPTLPDDRDVGPPPEASARPGKSMPVTVNAPAKPSKEERARSSRQRILVEATQTGYYDHNRRRAGDRFFIAGPEDFSKRWMRKAPEHVGPSSSTPNQAIRQQNVATRNQRFAESRGLRLPPEPPTGITSGIDQAVEEDPLND